MNRVLAPHAADESISTAIRTSAPRHLAYGARYIIRFPRHDFAEVKTYLGEHTTSTLDLSIQIQEKANLEENNDRVETNDRQISSALNCSASPKTESAKRSSFHHFERRLPESKSLP
jgi:hypothetical protein